MSLVRPATETATLDDILTTCSAGLTMWQMPLIFLYACAYFEANKYDDDDDDVANATGLGPQVAPPEVEKFLSARQ